MPQPVRDGDELIALEACAGLDAGDIGRKASVLAWAQAQGLPTPGGVVLPASRLWAALEVCGVRTQAQYLAAHALRLDPRHSMDLAAGIHAALQRPAAADLARAYAEAAGRRMSARPLVARSSAALEDGPVAAFAGIFVSCLDLTSVDELAAAIGACWQSAFSPLALQYLLRMRTEPIDFSLAVLIQPQIQAEWYGLYVSADPVTGSAAQAAELTRLGPEALASGTAATVRARQVDGAWTSEPDMPAVAGALARIAALAARLADRVPGPVDIEFALVSADAEPVLLQCRPITPARLSVARRPDMAGDAVVAGRPCAPGTATGLVLRPDQPAPNDVPRIGVVERLSTNDYDLIFRHRGLIAIDELSPLSHVAILCRELGVPLVCGAGPAARQLEGSWVLLDGSCGVAELVRPPPQSKADASAREAMLCMTDIELTLLRLADPRPASVPPAAGRLEREIARALGARQTHIVAVPLAPGETQQLLAADDRAQRGVVSGAKADDC